MKRVMRLVLFLAVAGGLYGCSGGGATAAQSATNGTGESDYLVGGADISNTSKNPVLAGLPPAPDKARNSSTVAGIDSDHDGVRDDIQRFIAVKYAASARQRAAASQFAKSLQAPFSAPPATTLEAVSMDKEIMRGMACLDSAQDTKGARSMFKDIAAVTLNTPLRAAAEAAYSDLLAGQVVQAYMPGAPGVCDQNMQSLPN